MVENALWLDSYYIAINIQFSSVQLLSHIWLFATPMDCSTPGLPVHQLLAAAAKSFQSCPTLCDPIDGSPPGSPVPGIFKARTLEWVAISFSNVWKWKVKVKSLSHVWLVVTQWTATYQAPPSMGFSRQEYWSGVPLPSPVNSWSLLKLMSIESVMPSNHLILCHPLLLLPSIFPSIRVLSNKSVLPIRWPEYWSFRFSISPSNEHPGLISFRMDWLDLLAVQGTQESSPTPEFKSINSSVLSFLYSPTLTSTHDHWKNRSFD